jgi:hypothetical protein
MEREAHMRTAVIEGDHVVALGHDEYRATWGAYHHAVAVA